MDEPGVVETVEQVNGAGTLGGEADPHLAGELGIGVGRQRLHLLMAQLKELGIVSGAIRRAVDEVDAVPGKAKLPMHLRGLEVLDDKIGDRLRAGHGRLLGTLRCHDTERANVSHGEQRELRACLRRFSGSIGRLR